MTTEETESRGKTWILAQSLLLGLGGWSYAIVNILGSFQLLPLIQFYFGVYNIGVDPNKVSFNLIHSLRSVLLSWQNNVQIK